MPRYDYHCSNCELPFEVSRSFERASDPIECPECGSLETNKKLTPVAFISNGSSGTQSSRDSMALPISASGCGCGACSCGAN